MIAQLIRFGLQFSWSRFCCAAILNVLIAPKAIPFAELPLLISCGAFLLSLILFLFFLFFFLLIISTFMAVLIAIRELCIGVQITRTLYSLICMSKKINIETAPYDDD